MREKVFYVMEIVGVRVISFKVGRCCGEDIDDPYSTVTWTDYVSTCVDRRGYQKKNAK